MIQALNLLRDEEIVPVGSIIRLYEVGRMDIMKTARDRGNLDKRDLDFYEYILVDNSTIKDNAFSLINVTQGNANRGSVLCIFNKDRDKPFIAEHLKKYFGSNAKVTIDLNE